MLNHENRIKEFERLKSMGVAGLKIDFFGGDGQSMINYYHDILQDAAPYGLMMNFHGATLPRGWQRTYPQVRRELSRRYPRHAWPENPLQLLPEEKGKR